MYYTGRTEAVESVNITPRVSGYIDNITFKAGDMVNKGDLLFVIDPRPYQAALDQARLNSVRPRQINSSRKRILPDKTDSGRQESSRRRISIRRSRTRIRRRRRVLAAQAAVESAQLNLTFTQVTSPIIGRIGREQVTVGNLVQADTTLLTNIVSVDPIYAYFNVDERSVLKYQQQVREGRLRRCQIRGRCLFIFSWKTKRAFRIKGVSISSTTSSMPPPGLCRCAVFSQTRMEFLIPGAFVRIRVAGSPLHRGPPDHGPSRGNGSGTEICACRRQRIMSLRVRPVELGPEVDGLRVVRSGLKGDEQVIINGIVNARPGSKVSPQEGDMNQFVSNQLQLQTTSEDRTGRRWKREGRRKSATAGAESGARSREPIRTNQNREAVVKRWERL